MIRGGVAHLGDDLDGHSRGELMSRACAFLEVAIVAVVLTTLAGRLACRRDELVDPLRPQFQRACCTPTLEGTSVPVRPDNADPIPAGKRVPRTLRRNGDRYEHVTDGGRVRKVVELAPLAPRQEPGWIDVTDGDVKRDDLTAMHSVDLEADHPAQRMLQQVTTGYADLSGQLLRLGRRETRLAAAAYEHGVALIIRELIVS